jgi:hypothetical protein
VYSDDWMKRGCVSDPRSRLHGAVYYRLWRDPQGEPVGIGIDFELADDVHFELTSAAWARLLAVLGVGEGHDYTDPLRGITSSTLELSETLRRNGIEFMKVAFW